MCPRTLLQTPPDLSTESIGSTDHPVNVERGETDHANVPVPGPRPNPLKPVA
jgi:hypothetical protein